jgi:hypothetical protein
MMLPLRIMFRTLAPSGEIDVEIREADPEPPGSHDQGIGCRLSVDLPHGDHEKRDRRHLRIELIVRGEEIVLRSACDPGSRR